MADAPAATRVSVVHIDALVDDGRAATRVIVHCVGALASDGLTATRVIVRCIGAPATGDGAASRVIVHGVSAPVVNDRATARAPGPLIGVHVAAGEILASQPLVTPAATTMPVATLAVVRYLATRFTRSNLGVRASPICRHRCHRRCHCRRCHRRVTVSLLLLL